MGLNLLVNPNDPAFPLIEDNYTLGKAVKLFLMLLNPLHEIPSDTNFGIYGFDLLSRVIASYMIYNFILASRRFV